MRVPGLAILAAATLAAPAIAQPGHAVRRHPVHRDARHARHLAGAAQGSWGSTVYGASLPSVNGTCVDPFDPDPIGGPDHVGDGGPGGYGPSCRPQAGVIPGTVVR